MYSYRVEKLNPNVEEFEQHFAPNLKRTEFDASGCEPLGIMFIIAVILGGIDSCSEKLSGHGVIADWVWTILSILILITIVAMISDVITTSNSKKINEDLNNDYRKKLALEASENEAMKTSESLNRLIASSIELRQNVLPFYIKSLVDQLIISEKHLQNKAINNYFDSVEITINYIACIKDILNDLEQNINNYTKTLSRRKHNFPLIFPVSIKEINLSAEIKKFNELNYKADQTAEFAMVFNQRKLIKVNISGFRDIKDAIDRAALKISDSLDSLGDAIQLGFKELQKSQEKYFQAIQTYSKDQLLSHENINSQLDRINNKLYYIQYRQSPLKPFSRPIWD